MRDRTGIMLKVAAAALLVAPLGNAVGRPAGRPAPPPSRYAYTLEFDKESLPDGVTLREVRDGLSPRHFIKNSGDVPLIIKERFQGERLVAGTKLVGGKVYQYFPTGVPMAGKQHLKGWQAPFGDIEQTLLILDREPAKIYEGRKPGLPKDLPPPEEITIPAKFGGKPHQIKATVRYHLNPAYDAHHAGEKEEGAKDPKGK